MLYPIEALSRATLLASVKGATVTAVDADGVPQRSCGFAAGVHRLTVLVPLFAGADAIDVAGGELVEQAGRGSAIRGATHRDTGANPSYSPRSQFDPTVQAEKLMRAVTKKANAIERRLAHMDRLAVQQTVKGVPDEKTETKPEPQGDDKSAGEGAAEIKPASKKEADPQV